MHHDLLAWGQSLNYPAIVLRRAPKDILQSVVSIGWHCSPVGIGNELSVWMRDANIGEQFAGNRDAEREC